jgi:methionyl-tRNA formyltransferase
MGGRLVAEACDLEERGGLVARAQPAFGATYASLVDKEDGRLDWNRPVEQVDRVVRAFSPWPGAFTSAGGRRLRVHRARPWHRLSVPGAEPGTIVRAPEGIGVMCNPGVLLLLEVQGEGRKRQEATEWLRGSRLPAGQRFSASA